LKQEDIIDFYNLTKQQVSLIKNYLDSLKLTNKKLNLVGDSTLKNPWDRHINDSLQLSKFIPNRNSSIIDLGTGAGLPGIVLSIYGYKKMLLVDSKLKKINFIRSFADYNKLKISIICSRVENIKNIKFDFVISRAFAPLPKILDYSLIFCNKNTSLLFLKGRSVKSEIQDAKKIFKFQHKLFSSKSDGEGFVLLINNLKKI
tara:strand:+ start:117 stop:722 length:606 start_codon:yes stop_codon:yes gene_type:complete